MSVSKKVRTRTSHTHLNCPMVNAHSAEPSSAVCVPLPRNSNRTPWLTNFLSYAYPRFPSPDPSRSCASNYYLYSIQYMDLYCLRNGPLTVRVLWIQFSHHRRCRTLLHQQSYFHIYYRTLRYLQNLFTHQRLFSHKYSLKIIQQPNLKFNIMIDIYPQKA